MNSPTSARLQENLSQGRVEQALSLLARSDPDHAASAVMELAFADQQTLFRAASVDLAARLAGRFPYYHAYVLLHARPLEELRTIVDRMDPDERIQFFEELPGEAWQNLMDEIAGTPLEASAATTITPAAPAPASASVEEAPPIIQALGVEKSFQQPDGRQIQVIAPIDLSIESGC